MGLSGYLFRPFVDELEDDWILAGVPGLTSFRLRRTTTFEPVPLDFHLYSTPWMYTDPLLAKGGSEELIWTKTGRSILSSAPRRSPQNTSSWDLLQSPMVQHHPRVLQQHSTPDDPKREPSRSVYLVPSRRCGGQSPISVPRCLGRIHDRIGLGISECRIQDVVVG